MTKGFCSSASKRRVSDYEICHCGQSLMDRKSFDLTKWTAEMDRNM